VGSFLWRLLIGAIYILGGLYLAFNPGLALESLTLAMALMFFFEGVLETVVFFQFRTLPGSGWVLFDGVVTLFLAYLIWRPWPGQLNLGDRHDPRHQPHHERIHSAHVLRCSTQDTRALLSD
jgi:uncharacterized membrane protein HdeD (DUF308 family)